MLADPELILRMLKDILKALANISSIIGSMESTQKEVLKLVKDLHD